MATTTNLGKVVITPRGSYSPSTAYVALDIIEYNGSGYLVLAPATGVTPPNATYYMLLVSKGVKGDTGQASTVEVGTVASLPAGSTPTVVNSGTENAAIFDFGLTQGNNWYTGDAITGTSTTPTAYATGITLAGVGDLYLNPSITADQGNVYQCTLGGNAATALWIYVGNITGTAAGAVAYTAQTPTSGQQIQARANINAASTTHASTHAPGGADELTDYVKKSGNYIDPEQASVEIVSKDDNYTVEAADNGKDIWVTSASNKTLTIATQVAGEYPADFYFFLTRGGTGTLTIAGAGTTIRSAGSRLKVAEQYTTVMVRKTADDTWLVTGNLSA